MRATREVSEKLPDEAMRAARADGICAKLGAYRIDMTREELLHW